MLPPNLHDSNSNATEIKVKVAYNGEIMITYIQEVVTYDQLCREIRGICRFSPEQVYTISYRLLHHLITIIYLQYFTMKWIDEENDPCTISSQMELDEAIRLYEVNRDSELVMHSKYTAKLPFFIVFLARFIIIFYGALLI